MRIGDEPLEIPGIALVEPVLPGVLAEDALLLLPALAIPGERDDARITPVRSMASALALSNALYRLIATQGWRSTISCLIPTTCAIGKIPVLR